MTQPLNIEQDFVVMSPGQRVSVEHNDAGLYARLDSRFANFAGHELIACYDFSADWSSWEMHPHGDEVVILLSGTATLLVREATGNRSTELSQPGQYVVVKKGCWHTAKINSQAKLLFITPGQGTENVALEKFS